MNQLLFLGYQRPLEETDIYPVPEHLTAERVGNRFEVFWNQQVGKSKYVVLFIYYIIILLYYYI